MMFRRAMLAAGASFLIVPATALAGPPFVTDDPEPVEYRHWEFYLATQHEIAGGDASGTAPHVEINYGPLPNLQLHLVLPIAYDSPAGGGTSYGLGDIELGAKLRFVREGRRVPMVGTFPLLEIPSGNAARGLGTGRVHGYIPIWLQKSFGAWTTYGGGGYWINPGEGNRGFWFVGWLVQRRFSKLATVGAELFYTTADTAGGSGNLGFNLGLILDITEHHHLLFSEGRGIVGESRLQAYLAYLLTL